MKQMTLRQSREKSRFFDVHFRSKWPTHIANYLDQNSGARSPRKLTMSATGRHDSNVRSSLPASHAIQNAHPYTRSSQESTGRSFLESWQWWIVMKENSTPADFSLAWFWHVWTHSRANRCSSLLEKKHVSILSAVGRSPEVINCQ